MVRFQPEPLSLNARAISLTSLNPTQSCCVLIQDLTYLAQVTFGPSRCWVLLSMTGPHFFRFNSCLVTPNSEIYFHIHILPACPPNSCRCCLSIHDLTHFMQVTFRPTISIQVLPDYIQLRDLLHLTDCRSGGPQNFQILVTSNSGCPSLEPQLKSPSQLKSHPQLKFILNLSVTRNLPFH
ncbi:hypothetical protein B0H13DRAFT_1908592 [Mycena leptocephala]|nr:hypothetical protein B0H13DRAFT_1908592 [Mycena leptocephala]